MSSTVKARRLYVPPSTVYTLVLHKVNQFSALLACINEATVRDKRNYTHFSMLCFKGREYNHVDHRA